MKLLLGLCFLTPFLAIAFVRVFCQAETATVLR